MLSTPPLGKAFSSLRGPSRNLVKATDSILKLWILPKIQEMHPVVCSLGCSTLQNIDFSEAEPECMLLPSFCQR